MPESFPCHDDAEVSMKKCKKSDDHEEVQNAHYDTLCKIDDININVSRTQIIIIILINSH